MSVESIKHLVFREEPQEVHRFPMYRSKFSKQVREEMQRVKECHRTFGLPKEMLVPKPFKKGNRIVIRPNVDKSKAGGGGGSKLSPVPRREDWLQPLHKERPYFPLRNALSAVRSRPPQGPSRAFDSAAGRRVHACNLLIPTFVHRKGEPLSAGEKLWKQDNPMSGVMLPSPAIAFSVIHHLMRIKLQIDTIHQQGFGEVPKYLEKAKRLAEEERRRRDEERQRMQRQADTVSGVEMVTPQEREELIRGLKAAWEEQTRQYKLLPLVVDSTPMIKKKRNLEAALERIEKNIDLLERNKHIFVTASAQTP